MFWESVGGILVEEYMLVPGATDGTIARRLIDGLIVLGGEKRIIADQSINLMDRDVIAVQTKADRLGMYLMGQAFFSRELLQELGPRTIRSVAICSKGDSVMERLCAACIDVVV
ncbi:MAG: hypothetical protein JRE56_05005, partial [Deltaproteobacteria bacterium]|nr:hypothetical protein [Deltaproteobacteria bacterium]